MRFPGFIGPSYTLRSVNVDCQRCINLYPEINETGRGKEQEVGALVATPGLQLLVTLGTGPIRGLYSSSNGRFFAVSSNKLYELDSDWNSTQLGTLNSDHGQVSMADNGLHLILVDGGDGYTFEFATNTFAEITDPDFLGADQVAFLDTYFILNKPDSGQFYLTGLNDVSFDALDIKTSEGNPDNLVGILANNTELWLFNSQTTEIYFNSGNADFPFERIQGAFIEVGCGATFSIAKMANSVFWLGQDDKGAGMVYMAKGYQPQRISTHAVETAINSYTNLDEAVAYTYQENGHQFYVLNFGSANTTWVYDLTTNLWHERAYTNQGQLERHRANCHAYAFGTHVVGDYENGKLYQMSTSVYSDNGNEITRRRVTPHLSSSGKRVFYNEFRLDIETGTGLDGAGQGTDPQVMLNFSDDGGKSWRAERWAGFGAIGQTKKQVKWNRLGSSRDRVFMITITDPVKVTLIGADLEFTQGGS